MASSILICTKDRSEDLRRCLRSLSQQTVTPAQLVIVDAGGGNIEEYVAEYQKSSLSCQVLYLRSEPGLTKQRNRGVDAIRQEIVHFLDDDVECDPRYVEEVENAFVLNPDVLAVGPRIVLPRKPSKRNQLFRKFFLLVDTAGSGFMRPSGFGSYTWNSRIDTVHEVNVLPGCFAIRANVFDQLRFDEYFTGYGFMEDLDFTFRVSRLGRILCNPKAVMMHWESPSARDPLQGLTRMQIRNHFYVFRKLMRQDAYHWTCYVWSELGDTLRRSLISIMTSNPDILIGMIEGYWGILRHPPVVLKESRGS